MNDEAERQMVTVEQEDPASPDASSLLEALSEELEAMTGSTGKGSFSIDDMNDPRAVFAIARDGAGRAVGCGAIRPLDDQTAEVKRVYATRKAQGIGSLILAFLERRAVELGYTAMRLETRVLNDRAVAFYHSKGYTIIPNYGRYSGREEAICLEKLLQTVRTAHIMPHP